VAVLFILTLEGPPLHHRPTAALSSFGKTAILQQQNCHPARRILEGEGPAFLFPFLRVQFNSKPFLRGGLPFAGVA
jgi:hypothetical protein